MALKSFKEVQDFITKVLSDNGQLEDVPGARHKDFWNKSYDDFVNGNVPRITDDQGRPVQILVKGNSSKSNIILALRGEAPFDGSVFDRMPPSDPRFTDDQIKQVADWIDAGCPETDIQPMSLTATLSASRTATGYSNNLSFDEAFKTAVDNLPPDTSGIVDNLTIVKVTNIGGEFGGIAGLSRMSVTIEAN